MPNLPVDICERYASTVKPKYPTELLVAHNMQRRDYVNSYTDGLIKYPGANVHLSCPITSLDEKSYILDHRVGRTINEDISGYCHTATIRKVEHDLLPISVAYSEALKDKLEGDRYLFRWVFHEWFHGVIRTILEHFHSSSVGIYSPKKFSKSQSQAIGRLLAISITGDYPIGVRLCYKLLKSLLSEGDTENDEYDYIRQGFQEMLPRHVFSYLIIPEELGDLLRGNRNITVDYVMSVVHIGGMRKMLLKYLQGGVGRP